MEYVTAAYAPSSNIYSEQTQMFGWIFHSRMQGVLSALLLLHLWYLEQLLVHSRYSTNIC